MSGFQIVTVFATWLFAGVFFWAALMFLGWTFGSSRGDSRVKPRSRNDRRKEPRPGSVDRRRPVAAY
jgi:hypothetical protein